MKKYIYLAIAAAFAACTSNDEIVRMEETQYPIDLKTFTNKITRATAADTLEGYHQSFGVWSYKTVGTTTTTVMDHYKAEYSETYTGGTKAQWDYEDVTGQYLKYWDKSASNYKFDAYAPYSSSADIANHTISIDFGQWAANQNIQDEWSTDLNTAAFDGTGATSTSASTDWMIADQVTRNNPISTATVDLTFKHILSKVVVKIIKKEGFEPQITVSDVSLNGVYGSGSYDGSAWSTGEATTVNIDCLEGTLPETDEDEDPEAYYALECLVIPAATTPTFSLTYTIGDDPEEFVVEEAEIETITSFTKGYNYVITVTVGPDPIHFDADVEDWDGPEEATVTVD